MKDMSQINEHVGQVQKSLNTMWEKKKGRLFKNSFFEAGILALILNLIIETLGRNSTQGLWGGINFFLQNPAVFLYNSLLIFSTLVFASIFKRRLFVFTLVSMFWLAIGIANGVVLSQRMTPFTVKDLDNIEDGLTITTNYLTTAQIIGIIVGFIAVIAVLTFLFIKGPQKKDLKRARNLAGVILVALITFYSSSFAVKTGLVETFFGNLAYAYRDYGVVYGFTNTWLNTGIKKPDNYTSKNIRNIFLKGELGKDNIMRPEEKDIDEAYPNILFLQLESFIDPLTIKNITLDKDPCPNFRRLSGEFSSGQLTVPACGAGTANVEFEVLTGLSAKFFGPGEYPYKSVLTDNVCESLAFDLKSIGYSAHAIHNHRAVFYNRNKVFSNIGFDTFTSVEYMKNIERTPKNWAKDRVLTECIIDALNSTDSRDMIYTISVQGHGKYPVEQVLKNPKIKVLNAPSEEAKWKFEYYVNQIYEMDIFIGELIDALEKRGEPTVLALYGDHIPAIDLREEDVKSGDLYLTSYTIWDNMNLKKKDENMYTYQMAAHVMDMVNMQVGTIFTYQQNHRNSETYRSDLEALGYDMLYGKKYIYGGKTPFEATKLKMGVNDISIEKIVKIGDKYYLKGYNFNAYSKVTLNGKELKTIYLGENLLGLLEEVNPDDVKNMKVSQIEKTTKEILSTTE